MLYCLENKFQQSLLAPAAQPRSVILHYMISLRKYGKAPYNVAVVHGGPGALGEMAPVARKLSKHFGVLEPLQTKNTIKSQVEELKTILGKKTSSPISLIGWSWGAWLALILAAKHPSLVKKLILVSSGPFEARYAKDIMKTRISRLKKEEKVKLEDLINKLNNQEIIDKNNYMLQLGKLISKADSYNPLPHKNEVIKTQYHIYLAVWKEASELRSSGKLLKFAKQIKCPAVAIHGNYDPHPFEGVKKPLSSALEDFKFILLKNCGHHPWYEKEAREKFFKILIEELK